MACTLLLLMMILLCLEQNAYEINPLFSQGNETHPKNADALLTFRSQTIPFGTFAQYTLPEHTDILNMYVFYTRYNFGNHSQSNFRNMYKHICRFNF
jgi:hypothetical protein